MKLSSFLRKQFSFFVCLCYNGKRSDVMKKELLSPVGNWNSLVEAIHNGCDAVYLGGKKFGARAFADNFSEEELIKAIKYCHLYGVKIYVTVNTMIYETELEDCLNYIRVLHKNNVDAIIMQDLGLIKLVRDKFPNLEIHASTQMHNHNMEQLKMLEHLGIKRVVLARELSIEEINAFKTNMEIEAFIHGALCISYSGQCLFSSLLMDRSGNRGSCAGICRLPFSLIENNHEVPTKGKYLLSPKEFSTLEHFKEIMESNIYSLKIEGRMKSPSYVGFATKLYRNLIDNYNENKSLMISEEEINKLKVLFNRGFTKGHLFGDKNEELMNVDKPNHQGIPLGTVLEFTKDKIKIKLECDLHQEDGIRFVSSNKGCIVNFLYNENGLLINHATKGEIISIDNKVDVREKGKVIKTIDSVLMKQLENIPYKKIPITCEVIAKIKEPLRVQFSDGENVVIEKGKVVEEAEKNPTSNEVIKEKIGGLGNSPFVLQAIKIICDQTIFIPMSELKRIRRSLEEKLIEIRENRIPNVFLEKEISFKKEKNLKPASKKNINVLVRNEEQLLVCLEENVHSIYVTDNSLYQKYKNKGNVYLRCSRVKNHFPDFKGEKLLVGETGSLSKYGKQNDVISDYYLNVANSASFAFLESLGASRITLSVENNLEQIKELSQNITSKDKIEVFIYGKPEVMVMKHCPLNMHVNQEKKCRVCKEKNNYYLKDSNAKLYRIMPEMGENHLTHLFHYQNIELREQIKNFQMLGIENYRIELLEEKKEETKSILCKML